MTFALGGAAGKPHLLSVPKMITFSLADENILIGQRERYHGAMRIFSWGEESNHPGFLTLIAENITFLADYMSEIAIFAGWKNCRMTDSELKKLKDNLWHSADMLRASAHLAANKYGQPILGLIFLRYADILFKQHKQEIDEEYAQYKGTRMEKLY